MTKNDGMIERKAEPVGYVSKYGLDDVAEGRMALIAPAGTFRPENEIPLYSTPPAEPPVERKAEPVKKGWRVFENIFRGEWGIEDLSDPDGDAILPPKRIDREHLDRIVSAYNAALSASPSPVGESRDEMIARLVGALEAAQELAKVAEGLTSCRSDDGFVWGVQEKINTALAAAKEQQP